MNKFNRKDEIAKKNKGTTSGNTFYSHGFAIRMCIMLTPDSINQETHKGTYMENIQEIYIYIYIYGIHKEYRGPGGGRNEARNEARSSLQENHILLHTLLGFY